MTTDYRAGQGKKLFGTGVLLLGQGIIWFKWPGIFTLIPLSDRHSIVNILSRDEIVIGIILAAYGMLVWEWVYFLDQQRGFSILNDLRVRVIQITIVVCILVFGGWWADSTYMRARLHKYMRSSRFVK